MQCIEYTTSKFEAQTDHMIYDFRAWSLQCQFSVRPECYQLTDSTKIDCINMAEIVNATNFDFWLEPIDQAWYEHN